MEIRTLTPADAESYQAIRLRSLQEHPEAFGSAYEDEAERSMETVRERLIASPGRYILGAWGGKQLVGIAGFFRNEGRKTRHRGGIGAMYVAPEARGQGVGVAILNEIIQHAKTLEGLEEIVLAVTVGNPAARKIYTQVGFEPAYIEKRYLKIEGRYYDLEWMTLRFV